MSALLHRQTRNQFNGIISSRPQVVGVSGDAGAGKGYIAEHLAVAVLGISHDKLADYPYVLRLGDGKATDARSQTGVSVEQVRELQRFLSLTVPGTSAIRRIIIIENLDNAGREAQNALLKTLEEPPHDTMIIVTFSSTQHVLPTIHSRIHAIRINPVSLAGAKRYAGQHGHDETAITRAYYMSGGMAGLFIALLNNADDHPLVRSIGEARTLLTADRFERMARVDALTKQKDQSVESILEGLYRMLNASYHQKVQAQPSKPVPAASLKQIADKLELIDAALQDIRQNVSAKLVLSRLFISI